MKINGNQIKRILKSNFPNSKFRVNIVHYTYDRAIVIKTDMLKMNSDLIHEYVSLHRKVINEGILGDERFRFEELENLIKTDEKIRDNIYRILKLNGIQENVSKDEKTGEILLGGNIYIDIEFLE